jgi:hypothetical protein
MDIDLGSIFEGMQKLDLRKIGPTHHHLTAVSPSGKTCLTLLIDTEAPLPLRKMSIHGPPKDGKLPEAAASFTFHGNIPVEDGLFLPHKDKFMELGIPVVDSPNRLDAASGQAQVNYILFKQAVANPAERPEFEQRINRKIDWDTAIKTDARVSAELRKILAPALKLSADSLKIDWAPAAE